MSDPDWPTAPWHLLLLRAKDHIPFDYLVEHSHRAAGYAIGCCSIVLAVGLWFAARRRALRWLGVAALLSVIAQGLLGGFRVKLDAFFGTDLAAVHGFFAQLVFSLLVCVAFLTAPRRASAVLTDDYARSCRRTAGVLAAAALLQVAFGVLVRHTHTRVAQRLHVLTAFAVVAAVVWFVRTAWEYPAGRRTFGRTVVLLAVLVAVQLALGVEAWMGQYTGPLPPELQPVTAGSALVRTLHVLCGAGVLATSVVAAMQAYRATVPSSAVEHETEPAPASSSMIAAASHHVKGTA